MLPEKLLTRRYALQADLWALGREHSELCFQMGRIDNQLQEYKGNGRQPHPTTGKSKGAYGKYSKLRDERRLLAERRDELQKRQDMKREQLVRVENDLRETFRAMGHSLTFTADAAATDKVPVPAEGTASNVYPYDVFVSHAADDKKDVVRELVKHLKTLSLRVWYDEDTLTIGKSLRETIDLGLKSSRFGIVVISPAFLRKSWTVYELNSLVTREIESGQVVLPIWHKVTKDEVLNYSLNLANKVALNTASITLADIALEIAIAVQQQSGGIES